LASESATTFLSSLPFFFSLLLFLFLLFFLSVSSFFFFLFSASGGPQKFRGIVDREKVLNQGGLPVKADVYQK